VVSVLRALLNIRCRGQNGPGSADAMRSLTTFRTFLPLLDLWGRTAPERADNALSVGCQVPGGRLGQSRR
jgi:hypothetical protein